jgi:pimeloyl-ACP methyl ester carboxylesterase
MHTDLIQAGLRAGRRLALLAGLALLLAGCATRPDLARLYEGLNGDPDQPPVIVIHGLMGSTRVEAESRRQYWPGSLGTLTFSNYRDLAQMSEEDREGEGLVPGDLFASVAGVDFYGEMLQALEKVGRFHPGVPGTPAGAERRHYYVMLYDWRKDNLLAVRKLHALIEQIRIDYGDPNLRVDIIAHSNGGLIANYYLRYGPRDVLDEPAPTTWDEGDKRIRRLVMLGTPVLGATTSLERLVHGTRMAVRTVPVEVMVTFSTPFQALPHPLVRPILDSAGEPLDIDIYDVEVWKRNRWGVFSEEVMDRVRHSMASPEAGAKALAALQDTFARNLRRGWQMQWALSAPPPATTTEVAVFGGDCESTPSRAVLLPEAVGSRLVFRPAQVDPKPLPGAPNPPRSSVDFERLMYAPGDGLVTRSSQVARAPGGDALRMARFHALPIAQTFFLCESHGRLTHNPYFQNNLLYFLLAR